MDDLLQPVVLIVLLFAFLAGGVWVALSLTAVSIIAMMVYSGRPIGDSMVLTMWGAISNWALTALPLFIWMGEILFRSRVSDEMFKGLSPWMTHIPGRLLHTNILGCTIFAAVSGSSVATMATIPSSTANCIIPTASSQSLAPSSYPGRRCTWRSITLVPQSL